jgi:hypothetical protein
MNGTFRLAMTALVSCCGVFSFAQTSAPPTEQKPGPQTASSDKKPEASPKPTTDTAPIEILTDTMGVDFGPYKQRVLHDVRMNWYQLIPEQARARSQSNSRFSKMAPSLE